MSHWYSDCMFRNLSMEEGDVLSLSFYAALDNSMSINAPIGSWTLEDGSLIMLPEE